MRLQKCPLAARSIEFIQVDVTSEQSQQALFDDVVSRYGQVDTVLAAAGVSSSGYISGEVSEVEADPEERMFHNRALEDWEKSHGGERHRSDANQSNGDQAYACQRQCWFHRQYCVYRRSPSLARRFRITVFPKRL